MAMTVELEDRSNTGSSLHQLVRHVESQVPELWRPYEVKAFARGIDPDPEVWTEKYFGTQKVYLDTNFAKERYEHLIEVSRNLKK